MITVSNFTSIFFNIVSMKNEIITILVWKKKCFHFFHIKENGGLSEGGVKGVVYHEWLKKVGGDKKGSVEGE